MVEGTQVGAYRLLRKIGEGGMGAVWLAEHAMLGRRAAIKVLHAEYSSRPEMVTRFFNEARAATAVGDPGIVQIFDFGRNADGSAYIAMELLDGEPLDRRLARHGALELADALRIMRQVASALGAAHAAGIVHRDLKPENVFVVRDPEVPGGERAKILDFGIAKLVGDQGRVKTNTKAVIGTPTYMSPEQCRGAGLVDQRSDVYALGCLLFVLLVGRPPFESEGTGEIIAMHLREPPPVPSSLRPGIPPEVDQLVLRCLAKDPARRFGDGGELAAALGGLLASLPQLGVLGPSEAYAPSAATTISSSAGATLGAPVTRYRSMAVFAGLGVVAVGGVIAIAVTRGDPEPARPEPGPASAPAPAPEEPVSPQPVARPDPAVEVAARTKAVLVRFVAWSRDHRDTPCPDIAALGEVPADPWGNSFRLTCTDQPGDQILGVISAGPDGAPGTVDDVASWLLGRDVTDTVRGPRWVAATPPASAPGAPASAAGPGEDRPSVVRATGSKPAAARPAERKPAEHKPAASRPAAARPAERARPRQDAVQLDEFGLPIKRK